MPKILVYRRYGRLTVCGQQILQTRKDGRVEAFLPVVCDCGTQRLVRTYCLQKGITKSCRCLQKEMAAKTHGLSETPEYQAWISAKNRCTRPSNTLYHNYGGRGITMCPEWLNSFETFLRDMGKRPSQFHTLERINNEQGYNKENCKWATRTEQNNNTRRCVGYKERYGVL